MNRVCCLQFVRLRSSRIPDKLLQSVGGVRLIDNGCRYLFELGWRMKISPIIACHPRDVELIDAARDAGVEVLTLDDRADAARIWPELIQPYVGMLAERFDTVWDANICCRPFLRGDTGDFIARQCLATERPFVAVTRKRGIVWSESSSVPVIGVGELADTRNNPHYFEPSHLGYVWPSHMLPLQERTLAEAVTPLELRLHWKEQIDIDTPEDLEHARLIARGLA